MLESLGELFAVATACITIAELVLIIADLPLIEKVTNINEITKIKLPVQKNNFRKIFFLENKKNKNKTNEETNNKRLNIAQLLTLNKLIILENQVYNKNSGIMLTLSIIKLEAKFKLKLMSSSFGDKSFARS